MIAMQVRAPHEGRSSFVERVAWLLAAAALAAAFVMPNHYPPWPAFHSEAAAFAGLSAMSIAVLMRRDGYTPHPSAWISLLILPIIAVQLATGQIAYLGDAAVGGLYALGFAVSLAVGSQLANSSQHRILAGIALSFNVAAVLTVALAICQWLGVEADLGIYGVDRSPTHRPFGNLAQPNHMGTLMVMSGVLSLELLANGVLRRWQFTLLILWLTLGLVLTESRTALASALVVSIYLLLNGARHGVSVRSSWLALWWVVLAVLSAGLGPFTDTLHLQQGRNVEMFSSSGRVVMWQQLLTALQHAPFAGFGWRQTIVAHKLGAREVPGSITTEYAHNIIIDLVVWLGVPVGSIVVVLLFGWFVRLLRQSRDRHQFVCLGALIPLMLHSLLEYPFAYSYFLFPAGILFGLAARQQLCFKNQQTSTLRAVTLGLVVFFLSASVLVGTEYLRVEEDHRVLRFEMRKLGIRPPNHSALDVKVLTQLGELHYLARLIVGPDLPKEEIGRLQRGARVFPWGGLHLKYIAALALNGQHDHAMVELDLLRSIYGETGYWNAVSELEQEGAMWPQLRNLRPRHN